ncbi:MAG: LysR family transcriptional regulator [Clostridiales bacterium]|nr:LysR family transcriptional regulator [Clostridiales bacterium]
MNVNYMLLKQFLVVAECGNITKAAKKLYLTQPTLSKSMRTLEMEIGIPLFKRNGKSISLTHYGREMAEKIANKFKEIDSSIAQLQGAYHITEGTVNISATPHLAATYLPKILKSFQSLFPEIKFYIRECASMHVIDDVLEGISDIGFCVEFASISKEDFRILESEFLYGKDIESLDCALILTEELCFICHPNSIYAKKEVITGQDLVEAPLILYNRYTGTRSVLHCNGKGYEITKDANRVVYRVSNETTIISMVKAGLGCGIISKTSQLDTSGVICKQMIQPEEYRKSYLIWDKTRTVSNLALTFKDYILNS